MKLTPEQIENIKYLNQSGDEEGLPGVAVRDLLSHIESQDERIRELEQTIAYLESVRGCDLIGAEAENFQKLMDKNYQDYLVRNNIPNKQR